MRQPPTLRPRSALCRLSAGSIARMLRGAVPGELPIEQTDAETLVACADEVAQ
jgi:hypothetical protein